MPRSHAALLSVRERSSKWTQEGSSPSGAHVAPAEWHLGKMLKKVRKIKKAQEKKDTKEQEQNEAALEKLVKRVRS